jgi:hypothetical protein
MCRIDRSGMAGAVLVEYSAPLPTPFQYFGPTKAKMGGVEAAMDYCPFVNRMGNSITGMFRDCNAPESMFAAEVYSGIFFLRPTESDPLSSICLETALVDPAHANTLNYLPQAGCYRVVCTTAKTLLVVVSRAPSAASSPAPYARYTRWVAECTFAGQKLTFPGYSGYITCPLIETMCSPARIQFTDRDTFASDDFRPLLKALSVNGVGDATRISAALAADYVNISATVVPSGQPVVLSPSPRPSAGNGSDPSSNNSSDEKKENGIIAIAVGIAVAVAALLFITCFFVCTSTQTGRQYRERLSSRLFKRLFTGKRSGNVLSLDGRGHHGHTTSVAAAIMASTSVGDAGASATSARALRGKSAQKDSHGVNVLNPMEGGVQLATIAPNAVNITVASDARAATTPGTPTAQQMRAARVTTLSMKPGTAKSG